MLGYLQKTGCAADHCGMHSSTTVATPADEFFAEAAPPRLPRQPAREVMPPRLLRLALVEERTGLKKSAIYAAIRAGTFPGPVRLTAQAVAWRESDITGWINSRAAA